MKTLSSAFQNFKEYFLSANLWRLVGVSILIILSTGILLGFAVMFIVQGTFFLLLRLTLFWEPTRKLFGNLAPPISERVKNWGRWKWIYAFVISLPSLLLIVAGIWILMITGFREQNFIYLLLLK